MDEDNIDININCFVGYIKLYTDVCIPKDSKFNRNDIIGNQSGIERRFFSGYFFFEKYNQEKTFYMKANLLTLDENIPGGEYIHALIKLFSYTQSQIDFLNNVVLRRMLNGDVFDGTVLNGLKENIGEFQLYNKIEEEVFFDGREESYFKFLNGN